MGKPVAELGYMLCEVPGLYGECYGSNKKGAFGKKCCPRNLCRQVNALNILLYDCCGMVHSFWFIDSRLR